MTSSTKLLIAACLMVAPAVLGLNNRSAVSINGLDTNPCTVASPCRSFGVALAATAAGGEVIALDSAGYGPFTVAQSVTVSGAPGVHAAITTSSGDGIFINTTGITVLIRNLVLIGAGGSVGIHRTDAQEVRVAGCLIRGFSLYGIQAEINAGDLTVEHTAVLDNTGAVGISIRCGVSAVSHGTITDSSLEGNSLGVNAQANSKVIVSNCTITGNATGAEADANSLPGQNSEMVLESCTIGHNGNGIAAAAVGQETATIYMSQNVVAFNTFGAITVGASAVFSFGNNRFAGNGTDGGPFPPIAMQ